MPYTLFWLVVGGWVVATKLDSHELLTADH